MRCFVAVLLLAMLAPAGFAQDFGALETGAVVFVAPAGVGDTLTANSYPFATTELLGQSYTAFVTALGLETLALPPARVGLGLDVGMVDKPLRLGVGYVDPKIWGLYLRATAFTW